jgi:hypothetical protein
MTADEQLALPLNITLTVAEVNAIINAMDEMVHRVARPIIDSLKAQAQPQIHKAVEGANAKPKVVEPEL